LSSGNIGVIYSWLFLRPEVSVDVGLLCLIVNIVGACLNATATAVTAPISDISETGAAK
jgi:hypothetical protein